MLLSDDNLKSTFRLKPWTYLIKVMTGCLICISGVAAARGDESTSSSGRIAHRSTNQINIDINSVTRSLPQYPLADQLNPSYRQQMSQELSGPLQRLVDLYNEAENADSLHRAELRSEKCLALVRLALYGHDEALKSLTDSSASVVPSDALVGKVGLMMDHWWDPKADAAVQQGIVTEFEALANANAKDDLLVTAALSMARYRCISDEEGNSLRDIVDHTLNGPAAEKYHHQLYKIGRPFKVSVSAVGGKEVSTTDWKGKVVLIDFWATWCPPCRNALPKLISIYQSDHDKGLEVLGISNDSSLPTLKAFLTSNKDMVWPESFNPSGPDSWNALSPKMGVTAIPTSFLIDRNGVLRDIEVAYLDEDLLDRLLSGERTAQGGSDTPRLPKEALNQIQGALPPEMAESLRDQMAGHSANHSSVPTKSSAGSTAATQASGTPPTPSAADHTVATATVTPDSADSSSSQSPNGTTPPATRPAGQPTATPTDLDKQANALLNLANSYINVNHTDRAKEKLNELLEKYPNSKSASKAKELLTQLNAQ